jgi:hypothetical protein
MSCLVDGKDPFGLQELLFDLRGFEVQFESRAVADIESLGEVIDLAVRQQRVLWGDWEDDLELPQVQWRRRSGERRR